MASLACYIPGTFMHRILSLHLLTATVALVCAPLCHAADALWTGGNSGSWSSPSSWSLYNGSTWSAGFPTAGHDLYITGGNAQLTSGSAQHNGVLAGYLTPSGAYNWGSGTLSVSNGAALTTGWGYLGGSFSGYASVNGTNSLWQNTGELGVGMWAYSNLTIYDSGRVNADSLLLGYGAGVQGNVNVSSGGVLYANKSLGVGYNGSSYVTIYGGGLMASGWAYLGANAGSSGTVYVSGSGSQWNSGGINTGDKGTGVLNINTGGIVYNNFTSGIISSVGYSAGSNGTVRVDGAGSQYLISGQLNVGVSGTGQLTLVNDGFVTVAESGGIQLAQNAGSRGTLQVGEGGSAGLWSAPVINGGAGTARVNFNHNETLLVGTRLTGSLSVTQSGTGATVLTNTSNTYNGGTIITAGILGATSNAALGNGGLQLDGGTFRYHAAFDDLRSFTTTRAGSKIDTNGFDVVYGGIIGGTFGWTKTGDGSLTIERTYSGSQTINVDGGALVVNGQNPLGRGTVNVTSGTLSTRGSILNRNFVVRAKEGQTATLIADDAFWNLAYGISVDDRSTLIVSGGSGLDTAASSVGVGGLVDIFGGSYWNMRAQQGPGFPARGPGWSVNGTLNVGNSTLTTIEDYVSGINASVNLNGASEWYTNAVIIQEGGKVNVDQWSTISVRNDGYISLAGGTLRVAYAAIVDTPYLSIGGSDVPSCVIIADSGHIRLRGEAEYPGQELNLTAGSSVEFGEGGAAGTLEALGINGSATGASVVFNHDETNLSFNTPLSGRLAVRQIGEGTTTFVSANTYTGGTVITDGTLVAAANGAFGNGAIRLEGGTLRIETGVTITNAITLAGGTLARSLAAGTQLTSLGTLQSSASTTPTSARIEGQMSATAAVETAFHATSSATNDEIRLSDVFTLSGVPVLDRAALCGPDGVVG